MACSGLVMMEVMRSDGILDVSTGKPAGIADRLDLGLERSWVQDHCPSPLGLLYHRPGSLNHRHLFLTVWSLGNPRSRHRRFGVCF